MKKCMDCGKTVSDYRVKRCKKCAYKGRLNHSYIDGRTNKKNKCKKCNKRITTGSKLGYCSKCVSKLFIKMINKHHSDLNRKNNDSKNLFFLSLKNHSKLHRQSYTFLVEKGLIKKYTEWFIKKFNPKLFNNIEYQKSRKL